jgi:WD40 repeat protein
MLVVKEHAESILAVSFSPDGKWFASASKDDMIKIHDGISGELKLTLPGNAGGVRCLAIGSQQRRFATAGLTGIARVWDVNSGTELCSLHEMEDTVINACGFSCDALKLATAGEACQIAVYERRGPGVWDHVGSCAGSKMISSLAWHPLDKDTLVAGEGGQATKASRVSSA